MEFIGLMLPLALQAVGYLILVLFLLPVVENVFDRAYSVSQHAKKTAAEKRNKLLSKNPFQAQDDMTNMEWINFVALGVILVPLRLFLVTFSTFLLLPLQLLSTLGADTDKPLSPMRLRFQRLLNKISTNVVVPGFGLTVKVKGTISSPKECSIFVVSPHSAFLDAIAVSVALQDEVLSMVGKKELANNLLAEMVLASQQQIMVDRSDPKSAALTKERIKERSMPNNGWSRRIVIFGEGTTTNRSSLIRFRSGAFQPGEPVQPIILKWEDAVGWTKGSSNRNLLLLRSLAQFETKVTAEFLPVYHPDEDEKETPFLYADNVRKVCAQALGDMPVTNFSFKDSALARITGKKGFLPGKVLPFSMHELRESLEMELRSENADIMIDSDDLFDMTCTMLKIFLDILDEGRNKLSGDQYVEAVKAVYKKFELGDVGKIRVDQTSVSFQFFLFEMLKAMHNSSGEEREE